MSRHIEVPVIELDEATARQRIIAAVASGFWAIGFQLRYHYVRVTVMPDVSLIFEVAQAETEGGPRSYFLVRIEDLALAVGHLDRHLAASSGHD